MLINAANRLTEIIGLFGLIGLIGLTSCCIFRLRAPVSGVPTSYYAKLIFFSSKRKRNHIFSAKIV